jgi:hypothetical protein
VRHFPELAGTGRIFKVFLQGGEIDSANSLRNLYVFQVFMFKAINL